MASNKDKGKEEIKHIKEKRLCDIKDPEERKRIYKEAREGKHKYNKGITAQSNNLKPLNERPIEEQKAIRRKAAEATNQLRGEKKTAKQILDSILPLYANNDAIKANENIPSDLKELITSKNIKITQYDLLYMAQLYKAQQGDTKAADFIASHFGDVVVKETHNVNEIMTQADKDLINKLSNRLNIKDKSVIDID